LFREDRVTVYREDIENKAESLFGKWCVAGLGLGCRLPISLSFLSGAGFAVVPQQVGDGPFGAIPG
jgi:hypothetical protein